VFFLLLNCLQQETSICLYNVICFRKIIIYKYCNKKDTKYLAFLLFPSKFNYPKDEVWNQKVVVWKYKEPIIHNKSITDLVIYINIFCVLFSFQKTICVLFSFQKTIAQKFIIVPIE